MSEHVTAKQRMSKFLHEMHRSYTDRIFGGVCGGLAEQLDVPAWIFRALFVTSFLMFGIGIIPYLVLWIFMPSKFVIPMGKVEK